MFCFRSILFSSLQRKHLARIKFCRGRIRCCRENISDGGGSWHVDLQRSWCAYVYIWAFTFTWCPQRRGERRASRATKRRGSLRPWRLFFIRGCEKHCSSGPSPLRDAHTGGGSPKYIISMNCGLRRKRRGHSALDACSGFQGNNVIGTLKPTVRSFSSGLT